MNAFKIMTEEDNATINTISFNSTQKEEVRKGSAGRVSYNRVGALKEAKRKLGLWNASDEFLGCKLVIREV